MHNTSPQALWWNVRLKPPHSKRATVKSFKSFEEAVAWVSKKFPGMQFVNGGRTGMVWNNEDLTVRVLPAKFGPRLAAYFLNPKAQRIHSNRKLMCEIWQLPLTTTIKTLASLLSETEPAIQQMRLAQLREENKP